MKRVQKVLPVVVVAVVLVVAAVSFFLFGWKKNVAEGNISFLEDTITVEKYETYTLSLVGAEDKEIAWKSEDESKADVKEGVVYAKSKGSTKIYATVDGISVFCEVVVTDNNYVPTISVSGMDAGINLVENQTYVLEPVLSYNGNTYTDAEYSYSVLGDVITVDESGTITTSALGEAMVCVTGEWRGNTVETTIPVSVLDVSTSAEVGDNNFVLYLNGDSEEYPSKVDLGITLFDKDKKVSNSDAVVNYVEAAQENDVSGAVTIKDGVAYAQELGTAHYFAEYTAESGVVAKTAEFSVTVSENPADVYMTTIQGEEFEFFFEPLSTENSVKWDEDMQAFHLNNTVADATDERAFVINKEYLQNIIKYTKAESIAFEYMTDGKATGFVTDDKTIYQGFYPNWFDTDHIQKLTLSEKWNKTEIRFDSIPTDENGNLKTIFLMNTVEGMYIRNIKLYLPGEDRTGYNPNHNYMEPIQGKEYEFFIETLSDENSVAWDEATGSYHLTNRVAEASDARGFIFNQDYFTNIIKHTNAETISFEYRTDGNPSGFVTDDETIYQGFYPDWYDTNNLNRYNLSTKWNKVEIRLDSIPKDENGNYKTVFLMNTVEGMYIRNIRMYLPGEERTEYDPNHNYMEDIQGTAYEFFIEALSDNNSVAWDEATSSYHLTNTVAEASDDRGFIFNQEYFTNIIKHTNAETISFEYRTDGNPTGFVTDDETIYQGYYPNWYDVNNLNRYNLSTKWNKVEIHLDSIPTDENGNYKTVFLMNTVEGMYIRNIKLHLAGEEDDTNYDPNHDYMEDIQGTEYEFFIEALSDDNSVKWDKKTKSYHLTNKVAEEEDGRGFIFNRDYLTNIIKHTKAESIVFEYKTDGKASGVKTDDKVIYQGYYPNWYDVANLQRLGLSDDWNRIEIFLKDIPKDENGDYKTIFLMNTVEGMYIRNIKLYCKGEERPSDDKDTYDPTHNYLEDITGKEYEFFMKALGRDNSVKWESKNKAYHLTNKTTTEDDNRGFIFDQDYLKNIIEHTKAESIVFEYKTDGKASGVKTDDKVIYQGYYPNWYDVANLQRLGLSDDWNRIEIFLKDIPKDENGNYKTIFLMNTVEGMYIRNIKLYCKGEERPSDDKEDPWGSDYDYLQDIQGESYEFFIEAKGRANSVAWDTKEEAYHLINKTTTEDDNRGFIFNQEYLENIIQYAANAESITFEFKGDGEASGLSSGDQAIYTSFYPDWYDVSGMKRFGLSDDWQAMEIKLADIPKDENGKIKAPFIMNTVEGLYIRNIKVKTRVEYVVAKTITLTKNDTWVNGNNSGLTDGNGEGTISYANNVWKIADCFAYATHKLTFAEAAKNCTDSMKVRFKIKATPNKPEEMKDLELRFYAYQTAGSIGDPNTKYVSATISKQNDDNWSIVEFDLAPFLNDQKEFQGFSIATFGYSDYSSGQKYTIEFDTIELLTPKN